MQNERLAANASFATILDSNPAYAGTEKSDGRQMKQC